MLPDRVWNPGPLTYESGALQIALRSPAADNPCISVNFTMSGLPLCSIHTHFITSELCLYYVHWESLPALRISLLLRGAMVKWLEQLGYDAESSHKVVSSRLGFAIRPLEKFLSTQQ